MKRGDRKHFPTYWGPFGAVRLELEEWVWDGQKWVHARSPAAESIKAAVDGRTKD